MLTLTHRALRRISQTNSIEFLNPNSLAEMVRDDLNNQGYNVVKAIEDEHIESDKYNFKIPCEYLIDGEDPNGWVPTAHITVTGLHWGDSGAADYDYFVDVTVT